MSSNMIKTLTVSFPVNGIYIRKDKKLQLKTNQIIGYLRAHYGTNHKIDDQIDDLITWFRIPTILTSKRAVLKFQQFLVCPNDSRLEEHMDSFSELINNIYNLIPIELLPYRGCLITIEGGDCVGKSTICSKLNLGDTSFILTKEPGPDTTAICSKIKDIILDNDHMESMDYLTEFMLYSTSRAQHIREIIEPALESGVTVIADRLYFSSIIYQGMLRGLDKDTISNITKIAMGDVRIDLVLSLYCNTKTLTTRLAAKTGKDRIENESISFHKDINNIFKTLSVNSKYTYLNDCINGIDPYIEIKNIHTEKVTPEEFNAIINTFIENKYNM